MRESERALNAHILSGLDAHSHPVPAQPSSQHLWELGVPGKVPRISKGLNLSTFLPAQRDPDQEPSLVRILFSASYGPFQP